MEENEILERLPAHLKQYIKPQNYAHYSSINQAVWRYCLQKNIAFLSQYAHNSYRRGLDLTGISETKIPSLYGMNRILKEIGWAAVAVDGFIPPRAFMEFQAYNVLVIASEIRQLDNIEYTPAPDIIHEAAGHAPMLANPEYAAFLQRFGELGSKAISSPHNKQLFDAIRKISILKESISTTPKALQQAENELDQLQQKQVLLSEMDQLRNLHWWSVEYGLIGTLENFKLYGAGLLSSIGESQWCLSEKVKKMPFNLEVVQQRFDITRPQPHLFVTPNFAHLSKVLEEVADTMSLRNGGKKGLEKLINSKEIGTLELSTGLQISGEFSSLIAHPKAVSKVAYFQTTGSTALAYRNQEIVGHGAAIHAEGFGSPIGKLMGSNLALEDMTPSDLEAFGIVEGQTTRLTFDSGLWVEGRIITGRRNIFGKIMIISFESCTVQFEDQVLFQPQWGIYDMAIGKEIPSVYAGPADSHYFPFERRQMTPTLPNTIPQINALYQSVDVLKETSFSNENELDQLGASIFNAPAKHWLLTLNFYEAFLVQKNKKWQTKCLQHLQQIIASHPGYQHLIEDGISLTHHALNH